MSGPRYARTRAGVVHLVDCPILLQLSGAEDVHEWAWARGKTPEQINLDRRAAGLDLYPFCRTCLPTGNSPPTTGTAT